MAKKAKLIPPDLERCQTEWREGSFMSLGPRSMVRCEAVPVWVATEKNQPRGSMSLCQEHREALEKQLPKTATFRKIVTKRAVEDLPW